MSKILVSLVSDQTIPNVLFIHEMDQMDKYLFITTKKMIDKGLLENTLAACPQTADRNESIIVDENSVLDTVRKLEQISELKFQDKDEFIVNITCGTKMMILGVYEYFRERRSEIRYIPIGTNTVKLLFPMVKTREFPLRFRFNLNTYFTASGINIIKNDTPQFTKEQAIRMYRFLANARKKPADWKRYRELQNFLRAAGGKIGKKSFSPNQLAEWWGERDSGFELEYLEKVLNELCIDGMITKYTMKYLNYAWLEEYVFHHVNELLKPDPQEISLGIHIKKEETMNELDTVFTHENKLYIIEVKTSLKRMVGNRMQYFVDETLYKADSLRKEFGLQVNSSIFTFDHELLNHQGYEDHMKRANLMSIRIFGPDKIAPDAIDETLRGFIGIKSNEG